MPSRKENTDARVHTAGDDRDSGAAADSGPKHDAPQEAHKTCRCGATRKTETCEACGKTTSGD